MKTDHDFQLKIDTYPSTLREIALNRMRDAIIAGIFEPGQRLVERKLCAQLGVSRSVIREVVRHLEAEGLIEMLPKQGPIVARISWDHSRQIYDIRSILESSAASACAQNADLETKELLRLTLSKLANTTLKTNPTTVLAATDDFYRIVFESAGHDVAWEIVQRLNGRISRLRVMTLSSGTRILEGPQRIWQIFSAIERNDPDAAGLACRRHISEARSIAESILIK